MANEELLKSISILLDKKLEPIQNDLNSLKKETIINSTAIVKLEQKVDGVFDVNQIITETNQIVKELKIKLESIETKVFSQEIAIKNYFQTKTI